MSGENGEGHVEGLDEREEIENADVRILVDDDGNELQCLLLAVLELDNAEYALLTPLEDLDSETEEMEVYVFTYSEGEDGLEEFGEISDENTYNAVVAYASTLMETQAAES